MNKKLRSSEAKIDENDLEKIERDHGIIFPASYRNFLLVNNGGISASSDERFDDAVFFGICDTEISLVSNIQEMQRPDELKIAEGSGEEPLILNLKTGSLRLDDKIVSPSFEDFVDMYLTDQ